MKVLSSLFLIFLFFGCLFYLIIKIDLFFKKKYSKWNSYLFYEFNHYEKIFDPILFDWKKRSMYLYSNENEHLLYPNKFNWKETIFLFLKKHAIDLDNLDNN